MAEKQYAVLTGLLDLDTRLRGFKNGELIVLASRPSVGKTDLAMNIALSAATRQGIPVKYYCIEQSAESLGYRMLSSLGNVDHSMILSDGVTDVEDAIKIKSAIKTLESTPLEVIDKPNLDFFDFLYLEDGWKNESGEGLIIVDYVQLMTPQGKFENRYQEVAYISRNLKKLAREQNVPVIAISQLSRNVEQRENKRPIMPDLRDSGTLEDDADVVLFLYRDDYYDPESEVKNIVEVNIAKNRNGRLGTVEVVFLRNFHKYVTLERSRD